MPLPLKYNWRHLRVRWRSTLAVILSIALVVAAFVMVMALAHGLRTTYLSSGDSHNLLVIRKGALAESSSQITVDEVRRVRNLPGIAIDSKGEPLAAAEIIVLITLERRGEGRAHVQVRGVGAQSLQLRPEIRITQGSMFIAGRRQCIVSRRIASRFGGCQLGQRFRSGKDNWEVVGIFDAQNSAYESEIWVDADEAREAFHRTFYGSVILRPANDGDTAELVHRIENERAIRLNALTEKEYYAEQTKTAAPIRIFGACLAAIMSIGAAFAAMNVMYAAVGARLREIGTLRVLGFSRSSIYCSFMIESLMLALGGGVLGCVLAWPLNGLATGTFNWSTFAEVAFAFRITPGLMGAGLAFGLLMGALGGLLPAAFAARRPVLEALRRA